MNAAVEQGDNAALERTAGTSAAGPSAVARLIAASRRYADVVALDAVDLAIRRGELLAVLGPNGAGKTTAISLLLGLVQPTSGRVELFGRPPRDLAARRRTGAMLQGAQLGDHVRVAEMVALYAGYYAAPLPVAETLQLAGLTALARRLVAKLSGGEQQRLRFALAICGAPDLLFLDEPTAGMDVAARQTLWAAVRRLREHGCSIVLTTHYLEEADALADRIVVLNHGRVIADGTPADIKRAVALRRIRCVTALPAPRVEALVGVNQVAQVGERLEIATGYPEAVLRTLFELDPDLRELEVTGARLDEAFLELTREPVAREAA